MTIENFWMFASASLMLNITPGNDMLYVITRSTGQGVKAGVVSALGIMGGCLVHTIAAVAGLSAILSESAMAFNMVKYAGAAYLVYLGVRSIISKRKSFEFNSSVRDLSSGNLFWQGVFTNVLNPKVALFFLAFLPQFVTLERGNVQEQILFLGIWFNISGTMVNLIVAVLFGKIGNWLVRSPKIILWQQRITGLVLIALGINVALSSRK